jgi:uncharacterized membrane protein
VVRERERTGAFDRAGIAVITPTGTGWVDSDVTDSLEFMYAGDALTDSADGVLLVGPPFANPIRRELIAAREPGSHRRHRPVAGGAGQPVRAVRRCGRRTGRVGSLARRRAERRSEQCPMFCALSACRRPRGSEPGVSLSGGSRP